MLYVYSLELGRYRIGIYYVFVKWVKCNDKDVFVGCDEGIVEMGFLIYYRRVGKRGR